MTKKYEKYPSSAAQLRENTLLVLQEHAGEHFNVDAVMRALQRRNLMKGFSKQDLAEVLAEFRLDKPVPRVSLAKEVVRTQSPSETLASAIATSLYRVETDAILLRDHDSPIPLLRIDKILGDRAPLWLSLWLSDPAVCSAELETGTRWSLLRRWKLPVVRYSRSLEVLPALGVLRFDEPKSASVIAVKLAQCRVMDILKLHLIAETCAPLEADRRLRGGSIVRRSRARTASREPGGNCLVCGLPLSDPRSVALGIGPYCLTRYHPDVIRAVSSHDRRSTHLIGGRTPPSWTFEVRRSFGSLDDYKAGI